MTSELSQPYEPSRTFEPARLMTYTLENSPFGVSISQVMAAALQAVEPEAAVRRFVQRVDDRLVVDGRAYDLDDYEQVFLVGGGKASIPMARAVLVALGDRFTAGAVITKAGNLGEEPRNDPLALNGRPASAGGRSLAAGRLDVYESGHPVPDERGLRATRRLVEILEGAGERDLLICLISGGGSALMPAPTPGIALEDLKMLTDALLSSGASIVEVNTLRKHLDMLKGGGLARLAAPAYLVTLILSDVVGDPLDAIASGPTVADPTTFAQAMAVLEKYNLLERTPPAILQRLENGRQGALPETPKGGEPFFERVQNVMVGSNLLAAQAALAQAQAQGWNSLLLTTFLQAEARQAGRVMAAIARQLARDRPPLARPSCIIAGGETTVTVKGEGLGGRNQELALGAVEDLAGLKKVYLVTLATDGDDGPSGAAGAVASGETLARARQAGLEPGDFLRRNDAYHFFQPLGDLIQSGPTQTNVNDLVFILAL